MADYAVIEMDKRDDEFNPEEYFTIEMEARSYDIKSNFLIAMDSDGSSNGKPERVNIKEAAQEGLNAIEDITNNTGWKKAGTLWSLNALDFTQAFNWSDTPGDYGGTKHTVEFPTNTSRIKIIPIGGYQIGGFGQPSIYCVGIEFKTQIEWVAKSYDPGGNRLPDLIATKAEATAKWLNKGPSIMTLGTDRILSWGCNDNLLTDNRDSEITFEIYYKTKYTNVSTSVSIWPW